MSKKVVLVGHCNMDGPRLQREIEADAAAMKVSRVNDLEGLDAVLEAGADLLLVNREPVGFDEEGIDLIRDLRARHPHQKVMLVSDYPEAQEEAIRAGALPGFGKRDMGSHKLIDSLNRAFA